MLWIDVGSAINCEGDLRAWVAYRAEQELHIHEDQIMRGATHKPTLSLIQRVAMTGSKHEAETEAASQQQQLRGECHVMNVYEDCGHTDLAFRNKKRFWKLQR